MTVETCADFAFYGHFGKKKEQFEQSLNPLFPGRVGDISRFLGIATDRMSTFKDIGRG